MDLEEDKVQADEFKNQGNESFKKKDYSSAVESYTNAINSSPKEPSYYGNRAACYLAMEQYQMCISDCNKALEIDSNLTKVLRRKGLSQMQLLQFEEAKSNLFKALQIDPKDDNLRKEMYECDRLWKQYVELNKCMEVNDFSGAVMEINQITMKIPKNGTILVKKVLALAMKGSVEAARTQLQQIQHMEEAKKDMHYLQGICELYNGNSERARLLFRAGMTFDPDNKKCRDALKKAQKAEELKEKGNLAIKEDKLDESILIYDEALLVDPNNKKLNSVLLSNRSLAWVKKKEFKRALEDVNLSIELNDKYFRAYLRRADIRMKMKEFDAAVVDYHKVKELDPSQSVDQLIREAKMQAKEAKKKDYYKILGVERTATEKEISKAYKKLALKWHPDKNSDNKEEANLTFRGISEAYQVLSDPKKKQMFDQGVDPNDHESGHGGDGHGGMDPNDIFKMFFGSQGGHSHGHGGHGHGNPGGYSFRFG